MTLVQRIQTCCSFRVAAINPLTLRWDIQANQGRWHSTSEEWISNTRPAFHYFSALLIVCQNCGEVEGNRDGYVCTRVRRWNDRRFARYLQKGTQRSGRDVKPQTVVLRSYPMA
jgi:hypothetical protein